MFLFAKLMEGTADSFTLVFYRSLVQIFLCSISIIKNRENPLGEREVRPWLLVRGGIGSGAVIAFFYAIQHLPLPDAVTLQFTTPNIKSPPPNTLRGLMSFLSKMNQ